jgi:hypothetical protein
MIIDGELDHLPESALTLKVPLKKLRLEKMLAEVIKTDN